VNNIRKTIYSICGHGEQNMALNIYKVSFWQLVQCQCETGQTELLKHVSAVDEFHEAGRFEIDVINQW